MTEVTGVTTRQIDQAGDDYAYLLAEELDRTIRTLVDSLPPNPTENDLLFIRTLWQARVDRILAPTLALLLHTGAAGVRDQLRDALTASAEPFHLPGRHDQKRHGRRYRGSREKVAALKKFYGDKLYVTDLHDPEVQKNLNDFAKLPEEHHQVLAEHLRKNDWLPSYKDAGVYFGAGSIPTLDKRSDLKDTQPRGWSADSTFSKVPGAYSPDHKQLLIGTGGHGCHSLAHHETGHAIDDAIKASSTPRYGRLQAQLESGNATPYLVQKGRAGEQESFAEAYALWAQHRTLVNSDKYRATEMGSGLGLFFRRDIEKTGGEMVKFFDDVHARLQVLAKEVTPT